MLELYPLGHIHANCQTDEGRDEGSDEEDDTENERCREHSIGHVEERGKHVRGPKAWQAAGAPSEESWQARRPPLGSLCQPGDKYVQSPDLRLLAALIGCETPTKRRHPLEDKAGGGIVAEEFGDLFHLGRLAISFGYMSGIDRA